MEIVAFSILLSYLILYLFAPLLYPLEGLVANVFMLIPIIISTALLSYSFILFIISNNIQVHVKLISVNGLGEVFGILIDSTSISITFIMITMGSIFFIYSLKYMDPYNTEHPVVEGKGRFLAWLLILYASTLALIFSSTLIQFLAFLELVAISCWGLSSYYGDFQSMRAGLKTFICTHIGTLLGLYVATAICINYLHDTSLFALKNLPQEIRLLFFISVLVTSITKSSQFPMYSWFIDAMVSPTPASAFLHGAAAIELGTYLLIRLVQFMKLIPVEAANVLIVIALLSIIISLINYAIQTNAKKLLAYSTIAKSAIMHLALAVAIWEIYLGLKASMYMLFNHAFMKGLAFLVVGLLSYYLGTVDMAKLNNLYLRSKFIALSWTTSLLGLSAIAPLPIFFSKLLTILALSEAIAKNQIFALLILFVIMDSVVLTIVSLRWLHRMILPVRVAKVKDMEDVKINLMFKYSIIVAVFLTVIAPIIGYYLIIV